MKRKAETGITNYLETFTFPDIPWQPYPVYSVSGKGNVYNLREILYPNGGRSAKKYTRSKQLKIRSTQARMFDMLINIGYWEPLPVVREFPIIIQNHLRLPELEGGYFLLDYFFPTLSMAIELDSDYHKSDKDIVRDEYMKKLGIRTFRIRYLERPEVQKKQFRDLTAEMRKMTPSEEPRIFSFTDNIRLARGL